ncbi:12883_t:CDS:2, partial [Racocetra persica]
MAKNNNVIEEIKELIQKIKNEYQEEVDFAFVAPSLINRASGGYRVKIISPRLKKFCREKFSLLSGVNYHLDYKKGDQEGNDFYYRICVDNNDYDVLDCVKDELYRGRKIGGFLNPSPNIISYFHPECAKKYFADKAQPNENNVRIKEKLLRNLDKICLDPYGYLANNECLKTDEAEEEYQKTFNLPNEYFEVKRELVKKIKQEIKQNPFEWKIEWGKNENYVDKSLNQLVKHQPS